MSGESFRARALHESLRYGDDPYVFIRELAQNARDARARNIHVRVPPAEGSSQRIVFEDDGDGMSFAHARDYLFKLYASSKEAHVDSVGHYGVGFWSVLRWRPHALVIESRTRDEPGWAIQLDGDLGTAHEVTCTLTRPGTRVVLERHELTPELDAKVLERLTYYCRYLRRRSRRAEPLPITFNGGEVTSALSLDAPLSLSFSGPDAEGVVALADAPRVELYARGLLVMRATVLEELEGVTTEPPKAHATGLAPVVILNSNSLDVVLSRQRPRAGKDLERIVKLARSRLDLLAKRAIDGVVPRRWHERVTDAVAAALRALGGELAVAVLTAWLVVGVLGALAVAVTWSGAELHGSVRPVIRVREADAVPKVVELADTPPRAEGAELVYVVPVASAAKVAESPSRALSNITGYGGPIVDVPDSQGTPWSLVYRARDRGRFPQLMFKALTLDEYDHERGWTRRAVEVAGRYPEQACESGCVGVAMHMSAGEEPFVVPVPTGFRVVARSLELDGRRGLELRVNELGEPLLVAAPSTTGLLRFEIGPARDGEPARAKSTGVSWPEPWPEHIAALRRIDKPQARARRAAELVLRSIVYDVSPAAAERFATTPGSWLDRVLTAGAGDCDVKNGVNVLLLRELGIPARLAVGIAAEQGIARPSLHAWTEYFAAGRWWAIDATGQPEAPVVAEARPPAQPVVGTVLPRSEIPVASASRRGPEAGAPAPESARVDTAPEASLPADPSPNTPPAAAASVSPIPAPPESPAWVAAAHAVVQRPWLAAAPLAFVFLLALTRRRWTSEIAFEGDGSARREAVARMLRDMLTQPASWRGAGAIWHRRVLPVIAGRPMSVDEALRRSRQGALFVSRAHVPLAMTAARAGTPILDGSDPAFGQTVLPLLRATDVDQMAPLVELAARLPRRDPRLSALQGLLDRVGAGVELKVCDIVSHELVMREVDVSRLRLPAALAGQRRFILINAASPMVAERLALMSRAPAQGLFVMLDWLLDRSELLVEHAMRLRELAAAEALNEVRR